MWPSRHGLGVQLSYGLHGGNIYSEKLDPSNPWKFSRERDGGLDLTKIHNSTQRLVPPQISNVEISTTKESKIKDTLQDIPLGLMHRITNSEQHFTSEYVYDPTYGKMIDDGSLKPRKGKEYSKVIAYVSGFLSTTLNVHVASSRRDLVQDESGQIFEIQVPILEKGASCEFSSPIKQIEICKTPGLNAERKNTIIVRTSLSVEVIKMEITSSLKMKLRFYNAITPALLFGESFSYFAPNPYDESSFAVVDETGNWGVFKVQSKRNPSLLKSGKIFEADDFSNFKRISWTYDSSNILVMSRDYVKGFNLETGEMIDFISAKRWSSIRDYKRWWSDDRFAFLLTSRELIWIDVSAGLKRILSWKHYLDAEDPSLAMQLKTVDSITFISIHSQVHPLVFIFQFKFEDGLPKSIHDPIMIKTDTNTTALDFLLMPVPSVNQATPNVTESNSLALFKISTQLEITRLVLSTLKSASLLKYSDKRRNTAPKVTASISGDVRVSWMNHRESDKVKELAENIFDPVVVPEEPDKDDPTLFQEYAISLGIDKQNSKPPLSVLKHAKPIDNFNEFEEFDNMMEQLQEFCEERELSFIPLNSLSSHVCGEPLTKIEDLYTQLYKLWNRDDSSSDATKFFSKHITKEIALALSIVYDQDMEERQLFQRIESLPKNLKKIVDDWDNDFTQEEEVIPRQLLETSVPEPIITVSQSQSRPAPASQGLLRPTQRASSQLNRPSQSIRAVPSQSQPKKKKRKIKGFG